MVFHLHYFWFLKELVEILFSRNEFVFLWFDWFLNDDQEFNSDL